MNTINKNTCMYTQSYYQRAILAQYIHYSLITYNLSLISTCSRSIEIPWSLCETYGRFITVTTASGKKISKCEYYYICNL